MMNLLNLLDVVNNADDICSGLAPVLRIVGIVIWGIKVVVPIILIVVGMIDLGGAVMKKKDEDIKAAQQSLIKKAIAAVLVFFVVTIVSLLMQLVGSNEYAACTKCINHPFQCNVGGSELPTGN